MKYEKEKLGYQTFKIYNHAGDYWINKENKTSHELIFFGGYLQTNPSTTQYLTNEVFSVDLNSFELRRLIHEADGRKPKARKGHAACISGNCLVVLGGKSDNSDYRNDLWMFVLKTYSEVGEKQGWIKLEIMPHGEDEIESEFTDLCLHTMTYIPPIMKVSDLNNSVKTAN